MIVGLLSDVSAQQSLLPAVLVRSIEALMKLDPGRIEAGRYELEGDKLFALIQDVESRSFEESRTEAHSKFADVQIPLSASERYGFSLPQAGLALIEDRMGANDVAFYERPARVLHGYRSRCLRRLPAERTASPVPDDHRKKPDSESGDQGPSRPAWLVASVEVVFARAVACLRPIRIDSVIPMT